MRLMDEFHRIFDGDDVAGGGAVAVIDHGGERGRFSRAGGANDQNEAPLGHDDLLQSIG